MKITKMIILLIIIMQSNSSKINNNANQSCPSYFLYDNELETCIHKGFFPIYPLELLQIIFFSLVSLISTSLGLGG